MKIYISIILITLTSSVLYSHCQVPCGIYDDASRIIQIREDINTIQKAIKNDPVHGKFIDNMSIIDLLMNEGHRSQKIINDCINQP